MRNVQEREGVMIMIGRKKEIYTRERKLIIDTGKVRGNISSRMKEL